MMLKRGPYPDGALSPGCVTMKTTLLAADIGKAVKFNGNYNTATGITVSAVTNGDQVGGRLEVVESDGFCSVDLAGSHMKEFDFVAGATPSLGQGIQGGTTAGTVKGVAIGSGGRGLVASIDTTNHKVLVLV